MNIKPQRVIGESFGAYQRRRAAENEAVERYLRRQVPATIGTRSKLGKAATKRMKRARRARRNAQPNP